MQRQARAAVTAVVILAVFSNTCLAQIRDPLGVQRDSGTVSNAAEYVFRNSPEDLLVPVYVIGAVQRPGLYHIPAKTDVLTLMALTGGPTKEANHDEIVLRKQGGKEVAELSLEKLVAHKERPPTLAHNDVLFVKDKEPVIGNNTTLIVSTLVGLMSVALGAFALSKTR